MPNILLGAVFRLLIPLAVAAAAIFVYLFATCYIWKHGSVQQQEEERSRANGLSESELHEIPTSEDVFSGTECAVCLDEIEKGQVARVLPACSHAFHLLCADTWLSKKSVCPLCRAELMRPSKYGTAPGLDSS